MTVYVDDAIYMKKKVVYAHMVADALAELHAFAARLSLSRGWAFHCPPGDLVALRITPHYDVTVNLRARAIALGALAVSSRDVVVLARRLRPTWQAELNAEKQARLGR